MSTLLQYQIQPETPEINLDNTKAIINAYSDPRNLIALNNIDFENLTYEDFLQTKVFKVEKSGFEVQTSVLNSKLFPFQKDIVKLALRNGKFAIFADCGLGKSFMEMEYLTQIINKHGSDTTKVLILCPNLVKYQLEIEGLKFDYKINICEDRSDVKANGYINVTNYERLHLFDTSEFIAVVFDESSILKNFQGKTRTALIQQFYNTQYKLCCTATPAPNSDTDDFEELGNHSEILNVLTHQEMLATFFINDARKKKGRQGNEKYRLKKYSEQKFWNWVAEWSIMLKKPSDLGSQYSDKGYELPELIKHYEVIETPVPENRLYIQEAKNRSEELKAAREHLQARVNRCAELVKNLQNNSDDFRPVLIFCNLIDEGKALLKAIPGSVEIEGSNTEKFKKEAIQDFIAGKIDCLISKDSMIGFGLNLQICADIYFVGPSHKFEAIYQCIARAYRFGQVRNVNVTFIYSDREAGIIRNYEKKSKANEYMVKNMIEAMQDRMQKNILGENDKPVFEYKEKVVIHPDSIYKCYLGDTFELIKNVPDNHFDFSIFSPAFLSLYLYSASERDLGNCRSELEFFTQFRFLIKELLRTVKPGRIVSVHCMDTPTLKSRDGYIGINDFPGKIRACFESAGWYFNARVTIRKNPVVAMQQSKSIRLLYKQLKKDATICGSALADYMLVFRKPGINAVPVDSGKRLPLTTWQLYADTSWNDIDPGDTLQRNSVRESEDDKHLCPLQLEPIKRHTLLYTNPNEIVFSPFSGIGSEGYVALQNDRRFFGFELNPKYFEQMIKNLEYAIFDKQNKQLLPEFEELLNDTNSDSGIAYELPEYENEIDLEKLENEVELNG